MLRQLIQGLGVLVISGLQGKEMTLCSANVLKKTQSKSPVLDQERRN